MSKKKFEVKTGKTGGSGRRKGPSIPYIKRAVAIEGDKIEIIDETIYINGKADDLNVPFYNQYLNPLPCSDNFGVPQSFVIPKGKIRPSGDNRRNSSGGREWGFVDETDIRAKGLFTYWSHDPDKSIFSGYRFDRLGRWLKMKKTLFQVRRLF